MLSCAALTAMCEEACPPSFSRGVSSADKESGRWHFILWSDGPRPCGRVIMGNSSLPTDAIEDTARQGVVALSGSFLRQRGEEATGIKLGYIKVI